MENANSHPGNPDPKKPGRLRDVFNRVAKGWRVVAAIAVDTMKDMRKPKEIGIFIASSFVPVGGWVAWAAYRTKVYYDKKKKNSPPDAPGM